jgi:hypothetical protein
MPSQQGGRPLSKLTADYTHDQLFQVLVFCYTLGTKMQTLDPLDVAVLTYVTQKVPADRLKTYAAKAKAILDQEGRPYTPQLKALMEWLDENMPIENRPVTEEEIEVAKRRLKNMTDAQVIQSLQLLGKGAEPDASQRDQVMYLLAAAEWTSRGQ